MEMMRGYSFSGTVPLLETANVVMTVKLAPRCYDINKTTEQMRLNLPRLSLAMQGGLEYAPGNFSAAIFRLAWPCCTLLLFESGNLVCTGANNTNTALLAINMLLNMLAGIGVHADPVTPCIQNIVSKSHVGGLVDLSALYKQNMLHVPSFTPELFPGCVYRWPKTEVGGENPKLVIIIFRSGKTVVTGARSREEAVEAWSTFYKTKLCKYVQGPDVTLMSSSSEYRCHLTQGLELQDAATLALQMTQTEDPSACVQSLVEEACEIMYSP